MKFFTVGTQALLLDASQNATFTSDVNIAGTTKVDGGNGYFRDGVGNSFSTGWDSTSDDHSTWINFEGYQGGTTKFRDLRIGNGKQIAFVHFDGSASTSNFAGNIYLTGSNDRRIKLSDSGIGGVSDSNNTVNIRGDNDNVKINSAANGIIIMEINGTEAARVGPNGIGFSNDSSANKSLNAYEEGNATLAIATSDVQYTTTGQTDTSRYIRIGNQVTIWASIAITSPSNGTGTLRVTGLPYANGSGGPEAVTGVCKLGRMANAATQRPYGILPNGSDVITFYYNRDGNTQAGFSANNLNGQITPYIEFTLTYEV